MEQQKTLLDSFKFSGVGIHSGKTTHITVHPAEENTGIVYIQNGETLPARTEYIQPGNRCTTLRHNNMTVQTEEHLMAALYGMGVSNAQIEIEGQEVPILDGSSLPIVQQIQKVGLKEQNSFVPELVIRESVLVNEKDGYLLAVPSDMFRLTCVADYRRPNAGPQAADLIFTSENFAHTIAPARTFGFKEEVDALLANGLGLGGSLDNALIISDEGPSTPWRLDNELAAHKLLDLVGDLALCGFRVKGQIIGFKTSHRLNAIFSQRLIELYQREM